MAALVCAFAFIVVAAKTHGRQIRLERELRGYDSVDFRAQNPEFVERLWRRDRRTFWPTFAALAVLGLGASLAPPMAAGLRVALWARIALLALVLPFALSFLVAGASSVFHLRAARDAPKDATWGPGGPRHADPHWRNAARRGSWFWWTMDAVAVVVILAVLVCEGFFPNLCQNG